MMDHGQQPDHKRQRVGSWSNNHTQDRPQLPPLPPPPRQYPHEGGSPFSGVGSGPAPIGPDNPLNPRRHSDHQPQYELDPRRPTSGPSHGYPPHHPQSAPPYSQSPVTNMKREPEEHNQPYRPPSRGNGHDHGVGPPHGYGHAAHVPSFEGPSAPPPPGSIPFRSSGPSGPPPTPFANPHSPMAGNEGYHPAYGQPPRGDPYSSVSYPPQGGAPKRKAQRAAQACDSCRNLKAKCDEGRPSCLSCKEKNFQCIYRDPPPKQQDKTQADILESLEDVKKMVSTFLATTNDKLEKTHIMLQSVTAKVDRIEKDLKGQTTSTPTSNVTIKEDEGKESNQSLQEFPECGPSEVSHGAPLAIVPDSPSSASNVGQTEEVGEPVKPGPSSIPVNHTTGAALLLLVGPIAELVSDLPDSRLKAYKHHYPLATEQNRGLLRLYGRGEGLDRPPGYEKEPLVDRGSEGTPSDTTSISDANSPPGEEWGQVGGMTPPPERVDDTHAPVIRIKHAINQDGMPDLTRETVLPLVESYLAHINIMHPIILPARLHTLVDVFLKSIPESQRPESQRPKTTSQTQTATFVGTRQHDIRQHSIDTMSPGAKRKRSPIGVAGEPFEAPNLLNHKPGHPFRSISTCLVLLVLALGKICLHKGKIPEVLPNRDPDSASDNQSPSTRNGAPRSPIQNSPTLPTTGLPSPQDGDRRQSHSRRSSVEGGYTSSGGTFNARNLDVIPGLAYFALATDILGNQIGGNSLQHVHAFVLASLYYGQLGRVIESSNYLRHACGALQVILRPKFERFKKIQQAIIEASTRGVTVSIPADDNPLVIAFWTCLQLESDIVAELSIPMSGILNYEEDMPHPNLVAAEAEGFPLRILESYYAQLMLRKHLNNIHTMFYAPDETRERVMLEQNNYTSIESVEQYLDMMMRGATPSLSYSYDDPPSKDILIARIRAKYYGAQVITYRTFVLKILEQSAKLGNQAFPGQKVSKDFKAELGIPAIDANATRRGELPQHILRYAQCCIKALINSTTAFYGLGDPGKDRLIVTNIWGTAHAQWGNVLTLLACYKDPILSEYIDAGELKMLLMSTLRFLDLYVYKSSALRVDSKILEHIGRKTGLLPPKEATPKSRYPNTLNSSFGSNSSGDVSMSGQ